MTAWAWPAAFFCLGTGAALGLLFLLCKMVRIGLGAGPWLTAALDVLFCLICGAVVFLCALAVDKGRLRLFQAALQSLGAWAAVVGLDPLAQRAGRGIGLLRCRVAALLTGPARSFTRRAGQAKAKQLSRKGQKRLSKVKQAKAPCEARGRRPSAANCGRTEGVFRKKIGPKAKKRKKALEKVM